MRQIKFELKPNTQTASLLMGDTLKECERWLKKRHPYHKIKIEHPCYVKIDYALYVVLDKKGFRPGLLAHELSHMVTGLLNDETRSSLIDSFMDTAFKELQDHGYKLTFKK